MPCSVTWYLQNKRRVTRDQPINQPINQPTNQTNQPTNQPINQPTNQPTNRTPPQSPDTIDHRIQATVTQHKATHTRARMYTQQTYKLGRSRIRSMMKMLALARRSTQSSTISNSRDTKSSGLSTHDCQTLSLKQSSAYSTCMQTPAPLINRSSVTTTTITTPHGGDAAKAKQATVTVLIGRARGWNPAVQWRAINDTSYA